jgi:rhodanese-related sulfurtransferase
MKLSVARGRPDLVGLSIERCENIHGALQSNGSLQLVDVRSRTEWLKVHLPGAISVPLLDLDSEQDALIRPG